MLNTDTGGKVGQGLLHGDWLGISQQVMSNCFIYSYSFITITIIIIFFLFCPVKFSYLKQ